MSTDLIKPWETPSYTKTIHRSGYWGIDPKNPQNSASRKVVVITGGGIGVGKGIASAFVQAGAKAVAIMGRREQVLSEAKRELEESGSSQILTFQADVSDESAINAAFARIEEAAGKIDVCIANAGYLATPAPAIESDITDWWRAYEINVKATLLTFRAFMAHKGSSDPTFISLNTGAAHLSAFPTFSSYIPSKLALASLVAHLQIETKDVRVVSLCPGVLETEMHAKSKVPLSFDDMSLPAGFAVWLASPSADFVGGRFLRSQWDVEELAQMKDEMLSKNELTFSLAGWPKVLQPVVA